MTGELPSYRTEDGATLKQGDRAYDYYGMKPGVIGEPDFGFAGWFTFLHDDGTRDLLNGQRICTMRTARRQGFPNPDPPEA
jgi:hypothetical protein